MIFLYRDGVNMKKINQWCWLILILFSFTSIFIFSYYKPFSADDYNYSNITWTNHRLTGIKDIFTSMELLYLNWTGRIPVQFIISLFLYIGKVFFSFANAAIYISLAYLLAAHAQKKLKVSLSAFIFASALMLYFIPVFFQTVVWLSGSVNYMWPTTMLILFLLFYENQQFYNCFTEKIISFSLVSNHKLLVRVMFFFLGLFAGWGQENVAFLGAAFLFLYLLERLKSFKTIIFEGIIGFIIGSGLLFLAPGNFNRAQAVNGNLTIDFTKITNLIKFNIYLVVIAAIIFLILLLFNRKLLKANYKYILAPFLSLLPLVIFPDIPIRSSFCFSIFLMIFILSSVLAILKIKLLRRLISTAITLSLCFTLISVDAFYINNVRRDLADEAFLINYNKVMGNKDPIIYQYSLPKLKYNRYFYEHDQNVNDQITPFSNAISNRYFSNYYGFSSVRGVKRGEKLLVLSTKFKDTNIQVTSADKGIVINATSPYNIDQSASDITEKEILFEIPDDLTNIQIIVPGPAEFDLANISIYSIGGTQVLAPEYIMHNGTGIGNISFNNINSKAIHFKTSEYASIKLTLPTLNNKLLTEYPK
ncbi:hypothetical protein D1872_121410 [compost metagenome]